MENENFFLPVDAAEADAAEILMHDARASEFWDGLQQAVDGAWTVTFRRGQTDYTLREPDLRSLALAFGTFNPDKFRQRQEAKRKREAQQQAAEQAAQKKQDLLRHALLGSGGQSNDSF